LLVRGVAECQIRSLLTFLAVGLYLAGAIPGSLLWLLVVRYPVGCEF